MRIAETIGTWIDENSHFVGGKNLFIDFLPKDKKEGLVLRLISSEVRGLNKIRVANMVLYYITENPAEADNEVEYLRKLLMQHRGIGSSRWSVLGFVEVENEGIYNDYKKVVSLRFQVGYLED